MLCSPSRVSHMRPATNIKTCPKPRQTRDVSDSLALVTYLKEKDAFTESPSLHNIANGMTAQQAVNIEKSREIGCKNLESMVGKPVEEFTFRKADQAVIHASRSTVKERQWYSESTAVIPAACSSERPLWGFAISVQVWTLQSPTCFVWIILLLPTGKQGNSFQCHLEIYWAAAKTTQRWCPACPWWGCITTLSTMATQVHFWQCVWNVCQISHTEIWYGYCHSLWWLQRRTNNKSRHLNCVKQVLLPVWLYTSHHPTQKGPVL